MIRELNHPFTAERIADLKVGEKVLLSGPIFTGRDRFHRYLFEGGKCSVALEDGAVFHCGPVVVRENGAWVVRAAGPTTSMRQEPYMARLIEQCRVRVIIGKGGMGEATRRACAAFGCVYLHAVGGAASVIAERIEKVVNVHFLREFGSAEAVWEMVAKGLEAVVTIDAHGHSVHEKIWTAAKHALGKILKQSRPMAV